MLPRSKHTLMRAFYPAYLALAATACAQTWTGAASGNWSNPANWDTGVPASGLTTAVVFSQDVIPNTVQDISGGLTLNSLTFGAASGVRTVTGNPLTFDGVAPKLRMLNTAGADNTVLRLPVALNQTLEIEGGPNFSNQFLLDSTAVVSGPGGVRIKAGITAFNAINTYSGQTVIEAGGLGVNRNSSFGSSPSVTVQTGGWIQLIGPTNFAIDKPLTIAGVGSADLTNGYALSATGGLSKEWTGPITLSGNASVLAFGGTFFTLSGSSGLQLAGHALTLKTSGSVDDMLTVSKVIGGSGNLVIQANSASPGVMLSAQSTFSGSVLVSSGKLSINSNAALGNTANPVTVNGGVLCASNGLTIPATRPLAIGTGGATFRGDDVTSVAGTLVLESALTGPNPIRIQQRVTLGGNSDFTGTLTVQPGGILRAVTDSGLGSTASEIRLEGGASTPARVILPPDFNSSRVISIPGAKGEIETTAPITLGQPITGPGELRISAFAGSVTLAAVNTHSGGTILGSGRTVIQADSALGAVDKPLTLTGQGILAPSQDVTIPATRPILIGGGTFDTTGVKIHVLGNIDTISGSSVNISGTGTFQFDGALTGGAYIDDATVRGTCTLDDFVEVRGNATLAPGSETTKGTITVTNIRMNEGTLRVRVGDGASDKLVVTQGVVLQVSAGLQIVPSGAVAAGETFTVLERIGTIPHATSFYSGTGAYFGNDESFTSGGIIWTINYEGGDGNDVTITALTGNAVPLAPPAFADLVLSPPTTADPMSLDSYPKISGRAISGVPGSTVYLESSIDLGQTQEWMHLETLTLDAAGTAVFNDRYAFDASGAPRNFYRLRVP